MLYFHLFLHIHREVKKYILSKGVMKSMSNNNTVPHHDELIQYIESLCETETSKPYKEINTLFVEECTDFLMELKDLSCNLSNEEIQKRIDELLSQTKATHNVKRFPLKRMLVAVACIVAALMALIIGAWANENNLNELLQKIKYNFDKLSYGDSFDYGDKTINKNSQTIQNYSSINDWLTVDGNKYLYPTSFVEDNIFRDIACYNNPVDVTKKMICFRTTVPEIQFIITVGGVLDAVALTSAEEEVINGITCYCLSDDEFTQCDFMYDGNLYSVTASSKEQINRIIKSIGGLS